MTYDHGSATESSDENETRLDQPSEAANDLDLDPCPERCVRMEIALNRLRIRNCEITAKLQ